MIQFNCAAEMASICHAKAEFYVIEKIKYLSCFFHCFMAVFEGSNFLGPPSIFENVFLHVI